MERGRRANGKRERGRRVVVIQAAGEEGREIRVPVRGLPPKGGTEIMGETRGAVANLFRDSVAVAVAVVVPRLGLSTFRSIKSSQ